VEVVYDLVASEGRYHRDCFKKFIKVEAVRSVGRPENPVAGEAFQNLCEYINNNDECQYSLSDLLDTMNDMSQPFNCYTEKHLKRQLLTHYKSDIVITELPGKVNHVSRREKSYKILTDTWYTERQLNVSEERIVRAAAAIIREDIYFLLYMTAVCIPF